ncbi:sugar ABC transporter substrate-binding protein [Nocardia asteroides]|uniref:sugar ABC transporter substrate-binding protein n=1 Tax=Nocardia asteroides TaxID=1824 RepID=UPI00342CEE4F
MKKKMIALALASVTAVVLAGCSTGGRTAVTGPAGGEGQAFGENVQLFDATQKVHESMQGKKVAFVPILYKGYNLTMNWGASMERAFGNLGAEFQVYDPNFDTDKMTRIISDLIARKAADVLILHNPDVGVLSKQIEDAQRAGIYTVVVNMISSRLGDAYIGVDNIAAAEDIASRAVQDCERRGAPKRLAIIDGPGNDAASLLWSNGVHNVLDPAGFEVVTTAHTQWQNSLAQQAAESIIQQQKNNFCGFLVTYDLNSVAVGDAVQSAVSRGVIPADAVGTYTMATDTLWCDALRAGKVTASASYDVQGVGTAAVVTTQQLVQTGAPAGSTHTVAFVPHTIVDRANVDNTTIACYKGQ